MDLRSDKQAGPRRGGANVVAWRHARLRKAGFDWELADDLSRECGVDFTR